MWKLLRYMKGFRKESLCAPLFKLLEAFFDLLVPLLMARIIDVGIRNSDIRYILRMCLVMAAFGVIGLACSAAAQYFSAKAAAGFSAKLRHELFAHIQALSFTELDEIGTSTLLTRMTSDINQVQSGVNLFLRLFMRSPFIVFGAMGMAFTIDAKAALVFTVVIPLLCIIVFGIMLLGIPLYRRVQEREDALMRLTRENLQGVRVIRAFCREPEEIRDFKEKNQLLVKVQLLAGRISALMNPMTYVVLNIGLAALLYVGAVRVNAGFILQGSVVALVSYMSQILTELVKLADLIITVTKAIASGNRIEMVLEVPAGMEKAADDGETDAQGLSAAEAGRNREVSGRKPPDRYAVVFDHVCFGYRGAGEDALTDLTFTAKRGETIGIIGGTGSGKTSLVSLIPRFYDVKEGSVCVDGRDVRDYPLPELRKKIGMVMQKPVLFKGTIRSNLLWGNEGASDEEMLEAIRTAQAEDILECSQTGRRAADTDGGSGKREHGCAEKGQEAAGLDRTVEQEGRNFSGGQRQRLTIARALVRKPEILILDDSASALDFATDARLRRAIRGLNDGGQTDQSAMTVFIVSQRTSSIAHADKIIVLEDGRTVGIGTHQELLENCEVYRETHFAQFPGEQKEGA